MNLSSIIWKLRRLRAMKIEEIIWRIWQYIQLILEVRGCALARNAEKPQGVCGQRWLYHIPRGFEAKHYIMAADKILNGFFSIFNLREVKLNFPPQWNKDPKTGTHAPLVFGLKINYRNENLVGNIKYLWEINRHLEIVTLAQAWHMSGEIKYAEGAKMLLESWFNQCPYPFGANWTSPLEHAIRLANWSFAWHLLGGDDSTLFTGADGQAFKQRWLQMIYKHCYFIRKHFSRYSSANNHLFGEYMGLFLGAVTWPFWEKPCDWQDLALRGLEEEAQKQIAVDGVNREQAIWYQHEVADMMLICGLVGKANGIEFSSKYWQRLEKMLEFIASILDVNGNVPMFGDADDAVMVRFSPLREHHVYRSLLATGAILFKRADFMSKAGHFDDKSRWMLGDEAAERFYAMNSDRHRLPVRRAFSEGGYYILGDHFETPKEVRIIVDSGPLGYLSIAAHGHADALSIYLSAGGKEFIIDPGTYVYHTDSRWRNYFRGTSAHNTVRIDGQDQSVIGGNFLWLHKATAVCEQWQVGSAEDIFTGSHDGYCRLKDAVIHRRCVRYLKKESRIEIADTVECKDTHSVERFWHFSEKCEIRKDGNVIVAENDGWKMCLEVAENGKLAVFRSDKNLPLGWISRRFDSRMKTTTAVFKNHIIGTSMLYTTITLNCL